jgi:hypothetical protein
MLCQLEVAGMGICTTVIPKAKEELVLLGGVGRSGEIQATDR